MLCVLNCSQINVERVEDLDSICEELLGMPLLLRVWAEHIQTNEFSASEVKWEGDLALLVDTSHPMIRPDLEKGLERCRKILQSRGLFCLQIDFGPAITKWLKTVFPRGCCTLSSIRSHKARLYITNFRKPEHCFDCNAIWYLFFGPCWVVSAPFYKLYRRLKCCDIIISPMTNIVRRTFLPSGKVVEITRWSGAIAQEPSFHPHSTNIACICLPVASLATLAPPADNAHDNAQGMASIVACIWPGATCWILVISFMTRWRF